MSLAATPIARAALCAATALALAACGGDGSADAVPAPPVAEVPTRAPEADAVPTPPGAARAAPAADPAAPAPLTPEGWGPLRIGMSRAEVVAALGEDADPEAVGGPDPERCDEFRPRRAPEGVLVMIRDGRLSRVSLLRGSRIRTERGIGVGDPAAAVRAAYGGGLVRAPHPYVDPPAEHLAAWSGAASGPGARGVLFVVGADGRVTHVRGGDSSIEYPEGCV